MTLLRNFLTRLHKDQEGQGLVEYLLILALVAFAATAGMASLASYLNVAFSDIGSLLNAYIS
jgi:pilus assembly protein Flp/PilA